MAIRRNAVRSGAFDLAPSDLPLLLISQQGGTGESRFGLDRIRVQKAVFLLTMGGPIGWNDLYEFIAYNWGPYSTQLAHDLDSLQTAGIVRTAPLPRSRYPRYVLTQHGAALAQKRWAHLDDDEQHFVHNIATYVTSRGFNKLLHDVYEEYPEYATESLFRPRRPT